MYLRKKTNRNGKINLQTISSNDVQNGDFEITASGSSALQLTVYQYKDRTWHSLGMEWQNLRASKGGIRRSLLAYLRNDIR
jgi:hypothetical protein